MTDEEILGRLREIKALIISARRLGDDAKAAELSAEKEQVKKRLKNRCIDCGVILSVADGTFRERCALHARAHRYYRKTLAA